MDIEPRKSSHSILIAFLATLPVLFRGLYFAADFFIFSAVALLWLALFPFLSGTRLKLSSVMDIALGGLTLTYLISVIFAVNTYSALTEAVKYLLFFFIFLAVKACYKKESYSLRFFRIFVYVLTLSAIISLLTATGILNFPGAYSASEIEKWLNGTVQYHNAFGALMLIGYFAANSINSGAFKSLNFALNSLCSYFLMFGLIMSYSRGAWVLVPVLAVLLLVFAAPNTKLRFFATGFASLIGVVAVLPAFTGFVDSENKVMGLLVLLGGMVLSLVLYYAFHVLLKKCSACRNFKKIAVSLIAVVVLIALLIVFVPNLFPFLPERLTERLSGISFTTGTVQERFVFYNDAFHVYKDHNLVFGSGGGAWQYLYGMYQSYLYYTTQAHSYIMQVLVETGAVGFIFWLATIVLFFLQAFKAKKSGVIGKDLLSAIVCAGAGLILHSFIDFDLSLPAIMLLLWCLLGILDTASPIGCKGIHLPKILTCILCVILLAFSVLGWIGVTNYENGKALKDEGGSASEISAAFKAAAQAMPVNTEYQIAYMLNNSEPGATMSSEDIEALVAKDPYNKRVLEYAFQFYDLVRDYITCMDYADKVIALQPLDVETYNSYAALIDPVLHQHMNEGDFKGAYEKALKILEKKDMMLQAAEEIPINKDAIHNAVEYAQSVADMLEGI